MFDRGATHERTVGQQRSRVAEGGIRSHPLPVLWPSAHPDRAGPMLTTTRAQLGLRAVVGVCLLAAGLARQRERAAHEGAPTLPAVASMQGFLLLQPTAPIELPPGAGLVRARAPCSTSWRAWRRPSAVPSSV